MLMQRGLCAAMFLVLVGCLDTGGLAVGTHYPDQFEDALQDWHLHEGSLSSHCELRARHMRVLEAPLQEVRARCGRPDVSGCLRDDIWSDIGFTTKWAWVDEDQIHWVVAHECKHHLLDCVGRSDPDHTREIWPPDER